MSAPQRSRVAIACQGGGSHTAFTAGVLQELLLAWPDDRALVGLSGTSGGALCATLAWDGLLRGDPHHGAAQLERFWQALAAATPADAWLNLAMQWAVRGRDAGLIPEVSPYALPPWGQDRLRQLLQAHLDFDALANLARRPGAPNLLVAAVEVRTGQFHLFRNAEVTLDALLASAAIPELFPAVPIPGTGIFWDGLFSQNPPIHELTDLELDALWIIQINPAARAGVPTALSQIHDRRNELAGNLALEQELRGINAINRLLDAGHLRGTPYRPIAVSRITLDRDLDLPSKIDRSPAFLADLIAHGRDQARAFLRAETSS